MFTDKLVAPIPSTATGIVREVNYIADDICKVGHTLLTIESTEGEVAEEPKKAEPVAAS